MVRMVVGVLVLLAAAFVLLNLAKQQAEALRPAAAGASAVPGPAAHLPQKMQQDVQKALQQGAAQRASDANP